MSGIRSRNKGKAGERHIAGVIRDLTGWDVRRRVRQHDGDSDLEGVPGWSVEVKDHATAHIGDVRRWWAQAQEQSGSLWPVLIYKRQRGEWRAVWPMSAVIGLRPVDAQIEYGDTAETSIDGWVLVAKELQ